MIAGSLHREEVNATKRFIANPHLCNIACARKFAIPRRQNLKRMKNLIFAIATLGVLSPLSQATNLAINLGPATSEVEAGYDLAGAGNSSGGAAVSLALGTFNGVTVTVTTGGSTENRFRSVDRGTSPAYSGPLDLLTQSWFGTQTQPSALTIILSGVDPGLHNWKSYHFDNGSGAIGNGNQNGKMEIALSVDCGANFSVVDPRFQIQDNEGTATSEIAPFSVDFMAVAGKDVHIRFVNVALGTLANGNTDPGQDFTVINGFVVTQLSATIPLTITDIAYSANGDPDPAVTLTWRARPGASYAVKVSSDLND